MSIYKDQQIRINELEEALSLAIVNKDAAENEGRLRGLELEQLRRRITYIKAEFDDCWKKEVITVDLGSAILAAMPEENDD